MRHTRDVREVREAHAAIAPHRLVTHPNLCASSVPHQARPCGSGIGAAAAASAGRTRIFSSSAGSTDRATIGWIFTARSPDS